MAIARRFELEKGMSDWAADAFMKEKE